jgi:hypothetical protein
MAAADLNRAKRISQSCGDVRHRSHAWMMITDGVKDRDPKEARLALQTAVKTIEADFSALAHMNDSLLQALLEVARAVDPERFDE